MQTLNTRVLSPVEAGDANGDYYYEINGSRSTNSYATRAAARMALSRAIDRLSN